MPWLALLPPLPVPPCCAAALFPLFAWFCAFKLLQETKVPVPDTHSAFWLEDCDWPMPWLAVLIVANTFTVIEVGPTSSTNDTANTAKVIKALFTVMKSFI
jgi:hypothetical protein